MSFSRVIQPRKGWLWGLQAHAHNRFAVCAAFTKIIMAAPGGPLNFLWDQDKENPPPPQESSFIFYICVFLFPVHFQVQPL